MQIRRCHFYASKRTAAILPLLPKPCLFLFPFFFLSLVTRIPSDDALNKIIARCWFMDIIFSMTWTNKLFSYYQKLANNWKYSVDERMLINRMLVIERNNVFCDDWERKKKRKEKRSLYALCNKLIIMWRYTNGYISHLCHKIN